MRSIRISRRSVVKGLAAAPFIVACNVEPQPPQGPRTGPLPPWDAPGAVDDAAFPWGVVVGDARVDGGLVSVRSTEPTITLVVMTEGERDWVEAAREEVAVVDGVARFSLTGLPEESRFQIAAFAGADGERRSAVTTLRTAPKATTSRVVRFGASSCFGGNAPWSSLTHAARPERALEMFLLLGDLVYADGYADDEIAGLYDVAMATQGMRDVTAAMPIVATWDDHEVQNNWSYAQPGLEERVDIATAAFLRAVPIEGGLGERSIYRSMRWGPIELFVLDSRGERRDGRYLSVEQMEWFKQSLSASTARFKIVLNSVPMTDLADIVGDIEADDRWQGYPAQRTEILEHIAAEGIGGVLWLSGDFHLAAIGKVDVVGGPGAGAFEVLCGPAGSPINQFISFIEPNERIPVIVGQHNCAVFEADPDAGTVKVELIADDGSVIVEQVLDVP